MKDETISRAAAQVKKYLPIWDWAPSRAPAQIKNNVSRETIHKFDAAMDH
jgi:hypothetical protein